MTRNFKPVIFISLDTEDSMNDHEDTNGSKESFREQDIYLPIANVARIMKNAIPQTGKVMRRRSFTAVSFSRGEGSADLRECVFPEHSQLSISATQPSSKSAALSVLHTQLLSRTPLAIPTCPSPRPRPASSSPT